MSRQLIYPRLAILLIPFSCGCLRSSADTILTVSYPEDIGYPDQVMGIATGAHLVFGERFLKYACLRAAFVEDQRARPCE